MRAESSDKQNLNENEFCKLMRSFETTSPNEFTDEQ